MKCVFLMILILGACRAAGHAQDVQVTLGDVTDKRTTGKFFAECEVELRFTGDLLADSLGVHTIHVKTAVDDTGRDLIPKEKSSTPFFQANKTGQSSVEQKVTLRNPARSAKSIRLLEGDGEVFSPTVENGGIVTVKDFMKQPGQPLGNPAFQKAGVTIMYITKEVAEAKKKKQQEEQTKAAAQEGGAFGQAIASAFGGMFGGMGGENGVQLLIEDPNDHVVEIEFHDGAGKKINTRGSMSSGQMHGYSFAQLPGPDTQLVIYLATPAATKVVLFKLENIPLP